MTDQEARSLFADLMAAFPAQQDVPSETLGVYVSQFRKMSHGAAVEAFEDVLRTARRFPTLSLLWDAYDAVAARKRAERERLERTLAEDNINRSIPVEDILRALPQEQMGWLEGHDETHNLHRVDAGKCDDCKVEAGVRYQFGKFSVCGVCARQRTRAATRVLGA